MIQIITINPLSPLSYLRDDCHEQAVTHIRESQRFESMYTLQRKTRPTRPVRFPRQSTYAWCTLPAGDPRTWQPFGRCRQIWIDPTVLEKKDSRHNPHHTGRPIHGSIPSFSPEPANEAEDVSQAPVGDQLLGLPGPISPTCDQYVQYLLTGPTHRSLTDTGGGYNLGGADFPHTTPRPSKSDVSHFP
jgi:hypothetical protein